MIDPDQADKVLLLLEKGNGNLRDLADISGLDAFSFYQGADLTDLNLKGQDLTGLNFDGADLRRSDLNCVQYDSGAFNNARLSDEASVNIDEFDVTFADLDHPDSKRLFIFCRIRPDIIDMIVYHVGIKYYDLAEGAGISTATLRKARRGDAIAIDTAKSLGTALRGLRSRLALGAIDSKIRQPIIELLEPIYNKPNSSISRSRYFELLELAQRMYRLRLENGRGSYAEGWRDSPSILEWYERMYFGGEREDVNLFAIDGQEA